MIDTDPVYEQIKYAKADPGARAYLDAHTHFFTYGENLGAADCAIPLCGVPWRPTRPPVDLDLWPSAERRSRPLSRRSRPGRTRARTSNSRAQQLCLVEARQLPALSRRAAGSGRRPASRMAMLPPTTDGRGARSKAAGWRLIDPRPVSASDRRLSAISSRGSRGEFTVAKDIYVRPKSGWFSDRSVCYLASGRPVVTMATEFSRFYPAGEGLFDYADQAEALAAIEAINADYPRHAKAARELAEEFFAGERVVGKMMTGCRALSRRLA